MSVLLVEIQGLAISAMTGISSPNLDRRFPARRTVTYPLHAKTVINL
jgi:hypothetical protein